MTTTIPFSELTVADCAGMSPEDIQSLIDESYVPSGRLMSKAAELARELIEQLKMTRQEAFDRITGAFSFTGMYSHPDKSRNMYIDGPDRTVFYVSEALMSRDQVILRLTDLFQDADIEGCQIRVEPNSLLSFTIFRLEPRPKGAVIF